MDIIEKCIRSSDLSGLHALRSTWDCLDPSNFVSSRLMKSKKTLLMTAAREGRIDCCKFLLSIDTPHINTRNSTGYTALHYAAYHGHEKVVFLLLEAGAEPTLLNDLKETALDSAIAGSQTDLVYRLRSSRFLKEPVIVPGLFDFSSVFLGDLRERLKSLPIAETSSAATSYSGEECSSVGIVRNDLADSGSHRSNFNPQNHTVAHGDMTIDEMSSSSNTNTRKGGSHIRSESKSIATSTLHRSDYQEEGVLSDGEVQESRKSNQDTEIKSVKAIRNLKTEKVSQIKSSKAKVRDDESLKNEDYDDEKEKEACVGLSRYEAAKYHFEVISVTSGGEEGLIGASACLLSTHTTSSSTTKALSGSGLSTGSGGKGMIQEKSKDDFTIGRSRSNDFPVDDLSISKQHSMISYFENAGFIIRDLNSKHGTFVDGRRIGISSSSSSSDNKLEKDENGNILISDGMKKDDVRRNNNGFILKEGSVVQFGRVVCRIFRKRQLAVISSGFQPNPDGMPPPQNCSTNLGQKRTALMALYGHYEKKPDKFSRIENGQKMDYLTQKSELQHQNNQHQMDSVDIEEKRLEVEREKEKEEDQVMEVGAFLLRKMGWDGKALGRSGAPASKPLTAVIRPTREGLGCDAVLVSHDSSVPIQDSKKSYLHNKMIARFHNTN